jgi:hypothetical protein
VERKWIAAKKMVQKWIVARMESVPKKDTMVKIAAKNQNNNS